MASKGRSPPLQTKERCHVCTYLGGGRACDNTADFVAVIITIISLKQRICALCLAGSKWAQQHTEKPTQVSDTMAVTYMGVNCQAVA
eukprot:199310-Ditylum_brightwellii.AAC.1